MRALSAWSIHSPLFGLFLLVLAGAVVDATKWADKMITRVKNASADWEAGVASPRRSPTAAMKAAAGKWKMNMQKAITEDRWFKAIGTLTDDSIKAAAVKLARPRFVGRGTAPGPTGRDA